MKVGFVGAGKVGCSLGKHFCVNGIKLSGYYSQSMESAVDAADFTKSNYFSNLDSLIEESDVIFITVCDDAIATVWDNIKQLPIAGKLICHCSGSLSSKIFSGIENTEAYGFSVHPLLAVSDRYNSYQELPNALFTIEGERAHLPALKELLESTGLLVGEINPDEKTRYHGAAVFASNLVVSLMATAMDEFQKCGLSSELLQKALEALVLGNAKKVLSNGPEAALTGPIERNDVGTVINHMNQLSGLNEDIYRTLSKKALEIGAKKHPDYDYCKLEEVLNT